MISGSPDLVVTMTFQPQDMTFTLAPRPSPTYSRSYEYRGCVRGPLYDGSEATIEDIPNSNGGWGVKGTVTVTVTNPTGKTVRTVNADFRAGSDAPGAYRQTFCVGERITFGVDGVVWQTALSQEDGS